MRLNPDCIRDILLSVEENTDTENFLSYPDELDKCPLLKKYSDGEIRYHMLQCYKSGLIEMKEDIIDDICIFDLQPCGHQMLADIRSDNAWNKTKEIAKGIGTYSLDALKQIASGVTTALIQTALGNSQP